MDKRLSSTHDLGYSRCKSEFRGQPPSTVVPGQTESGARVELVGLKQRDDPGLLLSRASLLMQVDRLGDAEAACLAAVEMNPQDPDAAVQLHALADAYRARLDWDKSARLFHRAVAIRRESPGSDAEGKNNETLQEPAGIPQRNAA